VTDGDVVAADQDLADDEPDDLLALLGGEALGVGGQAGPERFEGLGELKIGLGVVQLGVQRVQLGVQRGLALAELRGAGAQLVESNQLFLVAIKQPSQSALGARKVARERVAALAGGVRVAQCREPPLDLGLDQAWVVEQSEHAGPDQLVDLGPSGRAGCHRRGPRGGDGRRCPSSGITRAGSRCGCGSSSGSRHSRTRGRRGSPAAATAGGCCAARCACCAPARPARARTARR